MRLFTLYGNAPPKDETVSVRITAAEKRSLEADARRKGIPTGTVAAKHMNRPPALIQRTLLARDVNSIPDFLKERLREGKTHGGVIYVSNKCRQNDLRAAIRALVTFLKARRHEDWACREGWL